jgi:hypothetical protein
MANFIFLKYLRSLEEFRKNPHVKIPPKSPCANFQSLGIFKILIFIRKGIFFGFRPSLARAGPLCPVGHQLPARPTQPQPRWHICRKAYSLRPCALQQRRLLSPTSLHVGPACQLHPLPHTGRPLSLLAPPSFPYLNPPLNLTPVFNDVKAINAVVTPPGHPYSALPRPL